MLKNANQSIYFFIELKNVGKQKKLNLRLIEIYPSRHFGTIPLAVTLGQTEQDNSESLIKRRKTKLNFYI